ncbi:MAG: hypothetical protein OER92_02295 [Alphaproteobacteria bacterium]|nr:hypothetical protein [Alphaproteobacteria bacterium]
MIRKTYAPISIFVVALSLALSSVSGAHAQQLNCSLLVDSLESNITLSLKTAETLLNDITIAAHPQGMLVGETGRQALTNYIVLADQASARMSLVLDDLSAMNQIGAECIKEGHYVSTIGQARSANNIDRYLNEKFTGASSETSVFLTVATAVTLLARAIGHKKSVLSALVAEGYFLQ